MKPHYSYRNGTWVPQPRPCRTPSMFRSWLHQHGITLKDWAAAHGIKRQTASDVLRGNRQGLYGEAHKCAVAMGLKPDPAKEHAA